MMVDDVMTVPTLLALNNSLKENYIDLPGENVWRQIFNHDVDGAVISNSGVERFS